MSVDPSKNSSLEAHAPLVEHLMELRDRLLRIVIAVILAFLCLVYFANDIYLFVSEPLRGILPEGGHMIATEVTSPFFAPFKLTLYVAFILSIPYILYQIWAFIAPGLYEQEKKLAIPLLVSSILLFYAGIAFAYYVVFPILFPFFIAAAPETVGVMTDINAYLSFVLKIFFAFGVAFEVPIATVLLIKAGATDVKSLASKRLYVILGCFVVAMLLTPPDPFSQTLLAIPLWLLFELGLLIARLLPATNQEAT
ncbi:twin-arginine translocase subunit TatC [Marinospirillum sp.]|uniref:twin-arginine translocase subunit TatC n=1 Tax=Marinospirillum sp. TaxID=2183934 RepID=UPI003A87D1B8